MLTPISVAEFQAALAMQNASTAFFDVRSPQEYEEGHIPGVKNMPIDSLDQHLDELRSYQTIYLHCKSGGRCDKACGLLHEQGIECIPFHDGLNAWIMAGLPVQQGMDV